MNAAELRAHLQEQISELWANVETLTREWTLQVIANLNSLPSEYTVFPKTFTDPVLGPIELFEWEVALLDSPLIQRLRGVRQLGMAHAVYSGATHDRFNHTLGVIQVADSMLARIFHS